MDRIPKTCGDQFVVQRYLDSPLLVDGFKFDLRVYVIISGTKPVNAFVCEEGLARFCTVPYEKPTKENLKNDYMHLTNYSINKMSDDYVESEDFLEINKASKRTFTSLFKSLREENVDIGTIQDNIKKVAAQTTEIVAAFIEQGLETVTNGKDIPGKMF